jgi:thiol-disulfide isomerase/thioredoxin
MAVALVAVAPAHAATVEPFSAPAFEAAQKQGRPILVDVYADWCPVCRAQNQALSGILAKPDFKQVAVFRINFDAQQDAWRQFVVRRQSTLIAFHGRKEVGRSVAATDSASIEQLLRASLR